MFARSILVGLAFAVAALAQTQRLAFTSFPTLEGVTAGQPFTLRWEGGDGSPVTITLREGDAMNLNTIAVITGSATGNSFVWTPSTSLPSADDYALEISQGTSDPNYSGEFPIRGGASASTSGISTSTQSSASSVLSTITIAQSTQTSTLTTTFSSSVANATVTLSGSVTLSGTGSVGTVGPSVSRNTTFSSPTLSTTTVVSAGAPSTTVEATTTAAESGSGTAGAAASSSTSSGAGIVQTSVGFALAGAVGVAFVFFC